MSPVRRRVLFLMLLALAGLSSWQAITNNRERRELRAKEQQLDAQLEQKRKIAADLPAYQSTLQDLEIRLADLRRRTTPNLDALAEKLKPLGVSLMQGNGSEGRQPFTISGVKTATLAPAFREVDSSGHHIDALRIEVHEDRWSADLIARVYQTSPPPPPPPDRPSPWYGFLNAGVRERVMEKRELLEELDRKIGPRQESELRRELSLRLKSIESWESDPIDLVDLALQLFVSENPAFYTGRLERTEDGPRGGMIGRLARPMEDREIIALFGPLETRIVRRFRDTVEIAFVSR